MKFAIILAILVPFSTIASGNNTQKVIQKVETRLRSIHQQERTTARPVTTNQGQAFWASVTEAYNFLKAHDFSERYFFMYEAIRGFSMNNTEKSAHLKSWIEKENKKIAERIISPAVKKNWNQHVANVRHQVDRLHVNVAPAATTASTEEIKFLRDLNADLHQLTVTAPMIKEVIVTKQAAPAVIVKSESHSNGFLITSTIFAFFAGLSLMYIFRRKEEIQMPEAVITEALLDQVQAQVATEIQEEETQMDEMSLASNLEEECRKFLTQNAHIIQHAQMDLVPSVKSPFKTAVNITPEKLQQALEFFLKGTMSVVNSSRTKASSIDWSCSESEGRVYLEFTLHGVHCDDKLLYYNTLVDGTGSAPAYFGRTEEILEDHLASIQLESNSKRTSIALGLEAGKNVTSYC